MEKIITITSIVTIFIAIFMLADIAYNKIMRKIFVKENLLKYTTLLFIGFLFYKLPNQLGGMAFLFLLLSILLIKMHFVTKKLTKQTN